MKSFTPYALGLVSLIVAAGCSSSSPSSSTNTAAITGSVSNVSLNASSAIASYGTVATSNVNGVTSEIRGLTIMISDKANTCSEFHLQNSNNLFIAIPGDEVGPGTYPVVNANLVSATPSQSEVDFNAVDQSCNDKVAETATSGTITLTNVTIYANGPYDSIVSGTIDATFADGHLIGDFDAVLCPDDDGSASDGNSNFTQTCTP
jgi:hypothetical protein